MQRVLQSQELQLKMQSKGESTKWLQNNTSLAMKLKARTSPLSQPLFQTIKTRRLSKSNIMKSLLTNTKTFSSLPQTLEWTGRSTLPRNPNTSKLCSKNLRLPWHRRKLHFIIHLRAHLYVNGSPKKIENQLNLRDLWRSRKQFLSGTNTSQCKNVMKFTKKIRHRQEKLNDLYQKEKEKFKFKDWLLQFRGWF